MGLYWEFSLPACNESVPAMQLLRSTVLMQLTIALKFCRLARWLHVSLEP